MKKLTLFVASLTKLDWTARFLLPVCAPQPGAVNRTLNVFGCQSVARTRSFGCAAQCIDSSVWVLAAGSIFHVLVQLFK